MGTGFKGGATNYHSFSDNLAKITNKYRLVNGFFGEKGRKFGVRVIYACNPIEESKKFYEKLAYGGIENNIPGNKGVSTRLSDGTIIVYRVITSTKDSPAVSINIKYSNKKDKVNNQKIHFVKE
ncbi:MAG: hypothetical protein ACI4V7_11175 [Succinivibrionaceae bacterium]